MDIQEFPKALYRKGAYIAVQNADEEEAQRAEGFTDWHTDHESMQGADLVAAKQVDKPDDSGGAGDPPALSRDELKAKAKELSIEFARNIDTAKLADLVAAKLAE